MNATTTPGRRSFRIGLWIAYWVLIFIATHLPPQSPMLRLTFNVPDWLMHFLVYAALGFLIIWARPARFLDRWRSGGWPAVAPRLAVWAGIILAYAALDELTQPFIGRHCQLSDWTADALGAVLGLLLTALIYVHAFGRQPVGVTE